MSLHIGFRKLSEQDRIFKVFNLVKVGRVACRAYAKGGMLHMIGLNSGLPIIDLVSSLKTFKFLKKKRILGKRTYVRSSMHLQLVIFL